ncbi:MAG: hypothetical protein C5B43_02715 [Verrucomicrobia bacterium]|nr:MAG: hypothetical protein C5B43_02715 [Verrucomicrobiota bacterium]
MLAWFCKLGDGIFVIQLCHFDAFVGVTKLQNFFFNFPMNGKHLLTCLFSGTYKIYWAFFIFL